ncbi:hypothetical protein G6O67_005384 [Ophiocordyceps sinensis]|uniref:Uncharacterized protein n=1 Tax=Ophiocordyceps sinensis TaxID=72228 RepID=A0A8H4PRF6_9HYPO|nr:hypothetical protein G6O67_005384 [Ophiocordyceps sinensis]
MHLPNLLATLALASAAAADLSAREHQSEAAQKKCSWFGSRPICRGKCPKGWRLYERKKMDCLSGTKAYCCY